MVGQFEWFKTGCWVLHHGGEAAVVECPPWAAGDAASPVDAVADFLESRGLVLRWITATHDHMDHLSLRTLRMMTARFPQAAVVLQEHFAGKVGGIQPVRYFGARCELHLGGEPLLLLHAPKHSASDTFVIFRGSCCTGDWELGMLRSAHDDKVWARVEEHRKVASALRMSRFEQETGYRIHTIYSAHANDLRRGINFTDLMLATAEDREFTKPLSL